MEASSDASTSASPSTRRPPPAIDDRVYNEDVRVGGSTQATCSSARRCNVAVHGPAVHGTHDARRVHGRASREPAGLRPAWGALLYLCYHLVSNSYEDGPLDYRHPEGVSLEAMKRFCEHLGRGPSDGAEDAELMMDARKWSRIETTDELWDAWDVVCNNPSVRLAVDGVLSSCRGRTGCLTSNTRMLLSYAIAPALPSPNPPPPPPRPPARRLPLPAPASSHPSHRLDRLLGCLLPSASASADLHRPTTVPSCTGMPLPTALDWSPLATLW